MSAINLLNRFWLEDKFGNMSQSPCMNTVSYTHLTLPTSDLV